VVVEWAAKAFLSLGLSRRDEVKEAYAFAAPEKIPNLGYLIYGLSIYQPAEAVSRENEALH